LTQIVESFGIGDWGLEIWTNPETRSPLNIASFIYKLIINNYRFYVGDWGLGIGDWAQSPIPNPHPHIQNSNKLKDYNT